MAARAIAIALLLLALLPPTQAQAPSSSDWQRQIVAGQGGEDHDFITIAGTSGKIGVAFHRATSNDVGFAIGDVERGWTIKTLDIQSADTVIAPAHLAQIDNATWVISAIAGGLVKVYKSTDSGITWTVKDTVGSGVNGLAMGADGAHLALSFISTSPSTASAIRVSGDAGETWTTTLTGTSSAPGFVAVRGATVTWYSSSGTSTSSQDVKSRLSDDDHYWTTSQEVVESTSKSSSNLVAEIGRASCRERV